MRLKINIFEDEDRARRLKNAEGEKAELLKCADGAKIYDFAGLDFEGDTDDAIWIVLVQDE